MAAISPERAKPEKRTLRVLLTGFGPFRDIKNNPSWLAVSPLDKKTLRFTQLPAAHPHAPKPRPVEIEAHISALEVPVTYSAVLSTIPPLHASKQYDVMIHVGVSIPGWLKIERLAHKTGYDEPDAEGRRCQPIGGKSKPDGEHPAVEADADAERERVKRGFGRGFEQFGEELRTGVDVGGVVKHLKSKGLEYTAPSNDPGRFLCDFIYFCSLACAQKEGSKVKVLFMHVPPAGFPYQVEDMTRAVEALIEYFALHT